MVRVWLWDHTAYQIPEPGFKPRSNLRLRFIIFLLCLIDYFFCKSILKNSGCLCVLTYYWFSSDIDRKWWGSIYPMTFSKELTLCKWKPNYSNYFKVLKSKISQILYFKNAKICLVLVMLWRCPLRRSSTTCLTS